MVNPMKNDTRLTIQIPLTKGMYAVIDADDFEKVSALKWCVHKGYSKWYGARSQWHPELKRSKQIFLHNFIFGEVPMGYFVDHINGDSLDNRRENLRLATRSQNRGNARKTVQIFGRPTSSKYKGVCWDKNNNKWQVQMKIDNKTRFIGQFSDEMKAAEAYNKAASAHFGEFALLNDLARSEYRDNDAKP